VGEESQRIAALQAQALIRDAHIADLVDEVENLRKSREHAAVIEQAKGVIMSTTRCSADAAFAVLVAASQRENVKLFQVAERIASAQDEQP
jgi:AmiR/NasT family two-component response regulator